MKNLFAFAFAAAFAVSAFAAEKSAPAIEEEESVAQMLAASEASSTQTSNTRSPIWPAFFAFCEWPATPDLIGLRLSIPWSTKQECITGIDLGFWGECKDFEGIQINVFRSKVRDTFGGFQFSLYNSVNRGDLLGFQVGLWNECNSFRGFQAGVINVTGDGQGFQVGLINRAETLYGFQVGLINVIRDAEFAVLPILNIGF